MWFPTTHVSPTKLLLRALSFYKATFPFGLECEPTVRRKVNLPLVVWDIWCDNMGWDGDVLGQLRYTEDIMHPGQLRW